MINMKYTKIRTVKINDRGQIVIPEDIRKNFDIRKGSTLVVMERQGEIVLKKESAILSKIDDEEKFWQILSNESLKRAWTKEDAVWDKFYEEWNNESTRNNMG